jgi:hypothetical protein
VRSGGPRRLLGPTVGAAVLFGVSALVLWAVALWLSWGGECPNPSAQSGGLAKGIHVWPPAAQCVDHHGNAFWHEALPWAPWVVGVLIAAAAAILLIGLAVAIRDLRSPTRTAQGRSLPALEASYAYGGPAADPSAARSDADRDEGDPPAMAA